MISYRDGHTVTLCDSCYRIPPTQSMRTVIAGERALYMVEDGRVRGVAKTAPIELHFCNAECEASYLAPADRRRST